jgi:thymidine kinase
MITCCLDAASCAEDLCLRMPAIGVSSASQILEIAENADLVMIDEAQLFGASLIGVVRKLAADGKRVLVCGLTTDWEGNPWEPISSLAMVSEEVVILTAICDECGEQAIFTQRNHQSQARVLPGGAEIYSPRCRDHFKPMI